MKTHEQGLAYFREYHRKRNLADPEYRERKKAWKAANPEKVKENYRKRYERDRERMLAVVRAYTRKLRETVIAGYGGKCACCPESRYEFMAIDHVNGGGRKDVAQSGQRAIYRRVIKLGFPPEYQILCHNCNLAKGFYGVCPHVAEREANDTP